MKLILNANKTKVMMFSKIKSSPWIFLRIKSCFSSWCHEETCLCNFNVHVGPCWCPQDRVHHEVSDLTQRCMLDWKVSFVLPYTLSDINSQSYCRCSAIPPSDLHPCCLNSQDLSPLTVSKVLPEMEESHLKLFLHTSTRTSRFCLVTVLNTETESLVWQTNPHKFSRTHNTWLLFLRTRSRNAFLSRSACGASGSLC